MSRDKSRCAKIARFAGTKNRNTGNLTPRREEKLCIQGGEVVSTHAYLMTAALPGVRLTNKCIVDYIIIECSSMA